MDLYFSLCAAPVDFAMWRSISLFTRSTSSVNCCVRIFSFTRSYVKRSAILYAKNKLHKFTKDYNLYALSCWRL